MTESKKSNINKPVTTSSAAFQLQELNGSNLVFPMT